MKSNLSAAWIISAWHLIAVQAAPQSGGSSDTTSFVTTSTTASVTSTVTSVAAASSSALTTSWGASSSVAVPYTSSAEPYSSSSDVITSTVISSATSTAVISGCSGSSSASCTASSTSAVATPSGGLGTSPSSIPVYQPMSDFDFASLTLALYQEYIELDLFHHGLAQFSAQDFEDAGVSPEDQYLIEFMADQEVGHAQLITNILSPQNASLACNYSYPFHTVREFIDFSMKITRLGESGTFGFLEHLDSRASAILLLESISTESRQEMIFRQLEGLFPMPFWFTPAITQSMQWSMIAPYITSCPSQNARIQWQNFPALNVTNAPNASVLTNETMPAITHNRTTPLSQPGDQLTLVWDSPGKSVGPNLSYTTTTSAGTAKYAAWISQLNTTYTSLENVDGNSAITQQPGGNIFGGNSAATFNGTIFVLITDDNPYVTPFNLSLLNDHVVAGPALYIAG